MNATAERLDAPIQEEILLPVQYADMVRSNERRSPEHRLLLAVLEDAVRTWQVYANATTTRGRRLFQEVAVWFASEDDGSPFTFVAICQLFSLEPDCLRSGLGHWREQHRAIGGKVVPLRVRRVSGMRHKVRML